MINPQCYLNIKEAKQQSNMSTARPVVYSSNSAIVYSSSHVSHRQWGKVEILIITILTPEQFSHECGLFQWSFHLHLSPWGAWFQANGPAQCALSCLHDATLTITFIAWKYNQLNTAPGSGAGWAVMDKINGDDCIEIRGIRWGGAEVLIEIRPGAVDDDKTIYLGNSQRVCPASNLVTQPQSHKTDSPPILVIMWSPGHSVTQSHVSPSHSWSTDWVFSLHCLTES